MTSLATVLSLRLSDYVNNPTEYLRWKEEEEKRFLLFFYQKHNDTLQSPLLNPKYDFLYLGILALGIISPLETCAK